MLTDFFVGRIFFFENIGKEEYFHDKEKDKQFDNDEYPQRFSQGHIFKTFVVKFENPFQNRHELIVFSFQYFRFFLVEIFLL